MPKAQFPLSLCCLKEAVDQRVAPTVVLYDGVIAGTLADLYDLRSARHAVSATSSAHPL